MAAIETGSPDDERFDAGLKLVLPGVRRPAGAGMTWISKGWKLFVAAPLMWIITIVVLFVLAIVVNLVPLVGGLVFQMLQAVFAAGFVVACRSLERGDDFEIEHLFAGFTHEFVKLLIVGALVLLAWLLIFAVFAAMVGFSILGAVLAGDANAAAEVLLASLGMMMLGALVALALAVPVMMAFWFAPALVVMHGMAPVAAMKASFGACVRNFVPFLVYGFVMMILGILAMIPFGLGFLVWWPVAICSSYAAYREIFTEDAVAAPAVRRAAMVDDPPTPTAPPL